MRAARITFIITLVAMLSGCATINALITNQKLTPEARYYDALQTFNRNVSQYNAIYKLSSPATQEKWKASIDPLIKAASAALDTWKANINSIDKEKLFQDAFRTALEVLISSGIIKVEG